MGKMKIIAVASGGGHWEQLMIVDPAMRDYNVVYVSTKKDLLDNINGHNCYVINDCNRDSPLDALLALKSAFLIVFKEKPRLVISTGALPGLFCMLAGRLIGAHTIWIDSIANAEKLSMCGNIARMFCNLCITQWPHLQSKGRVKYVGSVL